MAGLLGGKIKAMVIPAGIRERFEDPSADYVYFTASYVRQHLKHEILTAMEENFELWQENNFYG